LFITLLVAISTAAIVALQGIATMAADRDEPHTIDDLAFIAGHWVGAEQGITLEETWLPPGGGIMVGLHRDVKDDGSVFYEFLRIEVRTAGIYYVARPSNQPEGEFRLKRVTADADGVSPASPQTRERTVTAVAIFVNPAHDFPQEIIYEKMGDGTLRASIHGTVDGKERWATWEYRLIDSGNGR
jgi:hypothetical protein